MENRKVWMNGKIICETEAKISVYDSALMYGDMVFEMTRSFNGKQFKLIEHIDRLFYGLKILRIPLHYSKKDMEDFCYETIEANKHLFNNDDEHRLMIDVSRGLLGIYHKIDGLHKGPNLIITDFPLRWTVVNMGHLFDKGINAVVTSQRAIPQSLLDPKIKNRSRIFYLMANIEASQFKGEDNWALLLDNDGYISEGTGDNFFIIKDNVVISPEGHDILRGISRDYVMNQLCPELGFEFIEKKISQYDVYTADEAFMTGTPFCMLPVTKLNGLDIGDGIVGPVYKKLLSQWSLNTGVNIEMQIKNWNKKEKANSNAPTPYNFNPKKK
ncbi:MAG: branched-chain amino acid aminotransferase [Gammaproteobacteria bacterium]|nr:branched-chain amino acid aminotransferase [Gammaproteobacteria bacterium]